MILLIGSEKGGTGKSTVASNLAAMMAGDGYDVLLVDTDTQASVSDWAAIRNNNEGLSRLTTVQKTGKVHADIARLKDKYDHIVIDAGGRDSTELRSSLLAADVCYMPITPSTYDLWTVPRFYTLLDDARLINDRLTAYVLVNQASTHAMVNDHRDIERFLADEDYDSFGLANAVLKFRNAYKTAATRGKSVMELKSNGKSDEKAKTEMTNLYKEVMNHAN